MVNHLSFEEVLFDTEDAIINDRFTGFREDYLILHSLIRKFKPQSYFEIGTNMGEGLNIAINALKKHAPDYKAYSLDLPTELAHISLQHPISEGKGDKVGSWCTFPYIQLRGDSVHFDYSKYPCEVFYIDGEHTTFNVNIESHKVMSLPTTKAVIWHDTDIPEVMEGIKQAMKVSKDFVLYRVEGTRISYAVRK